MNPLLARQLRRLKLDPSSPPDAPTWDKLLARLDAVFNHNDQTLSRLDRSLKLSSEEMQNIYDTLRQNEHQIEQQRDQLDAVLDAVHAGICAISPDGEVLFMNQGAKELLAIEDQAPLPHSSRLLMKFQPNNKPLSLERMFSMLEQQPVTVFEHCILNQGDKELPISLHLSSLTRHDSKGFVVMAFQDISEQLRAAESRQQAQKMDVLGSLIGGISHELNNMLASITGNLFLAKAGLSEQDGIIKRLDIAERLSFDMGDVIAHLMAFSGQSIVSKEVVNMQKLISFAADSYRHTVPAHIAFKSYICTQYMDIFAAREQIQQLLTHLLNNAQDAVATSASPTIQVHLEHFVADEEFSQRHRLSQHHFARLSIHDNGIGIDEHMIPHIFEPFYTGKNFGEGKGLGLSMVQGAVQMHNGVLEVETTLNVGSTFHIYLPLEKQDSHPDEHENHEQQPQRNTLCSTTNTILLVEDDVNVQAITKELLIALDYDVLTANDGLEAVAVYKENQDEIGLVLMDIMMPNMLGTAAWLEIRDFDPQAKVIFVSGFDQNSKHLADSGLEHELFLSKPYDISQLCAMLAGELGHDTL